MLRALCLALFCLWTGFRMPETGWAAAVTLTLPERAVVTTDDIVVKEILAAGTQDAERPSEDAERSVMDMVVGRSPSPGKSRWIDRDYIALRLRQAGGAAAVTVRGPDRIEIVREAVTIPESEIEAMVLAFLKERLASFGSDAEIERIRGAKAMVLPTGRITHEIDIPAHGDLAGNVRVTIAFSADGKPAGRAHVYARINRMIEVVAAVRPLDRNRAITPADVAVKKMDAAGVAANALVRVADAVGKIARKRIAAGDVLRPDMVERPFLVERGDIVKIVARSGRISIATLGEVRKKGRENDRIRVLNLDSDQDVYARVVDADTVAVNF